MSESELWVFETTATPQSLEDFRGVLAKVWSAHAEVPDSVRAEMSIAVAEIAANIVEHAAKGRAVTVRMEVMVLPDELEVRFIDDGHRAEVDLESVQMPDVDAERGRGLAVAQAVLRRLSYRRAEDGNHWTLVSERFSV